MRIAFLDSLRPVCPVCRDDAGEAAAPLTLSHVAEQTAGGEVLQGILVCSREACRCEFPILDGIPLIVPHVRSYVADNIQHLCRRQDLSDVVESLLGDCCGPGTGFDATRQQLSCYGSNHYADCLLTSRAEEAAADPTRTEQAPDGSVLSLLNAGLSALDRPWAGPLLDVGCGTGRTTFELANRSDQLVLGVDLNFPLLQLAARAMRSGQGSFPLRRGGVAYERRAFRVPCEDPQRVDFWACDAAALPLERGSCDTVVCLNVLDSTPSPLAVLQQIQRVTRRLGWNVLAAPYDWSGAVTPIEQWFGGHSQRATLAADSAAILRSLLTTSAAAAGLQAMTIVREFDRLPWFTRLHDRSTVHYDVHLLVAQRA